MEYKNIDYYLNLPWSYTLEEEQNHGKTYYIIKVNEMPGICTDSTDLFEALKEIKQLIACAIEIYKEKGEPIPEPLNKDKFKGKILYRTSKERHFNLAKLAQQRHLSMSKTLDLVFDVGMQHV